MGGFVSADLGGPWGGGGRFVALCSLDTGVLNGNGAPLLKKAKIYFFGSWSHQGLYLFSRFGGINRTFFSPPSLSEIHFFSFEVHLKKKENREEDRGPKCHGCN